MSKLYAGLFGLFVLGVGAASSLYIVDEREKALVLEFGKIKKTVVEPGLGFKVPFIQQVVRYDDRILKLSIEAIEVTPLDDRRLTVGAFGRWRISDLERFRQASSDGGVMAVEERLAGILDSTISQVLGSVPSNAVLSEDRTGLMEKILASVRQQALPLGVELIDVRLTRTDLPQANLASTYARMRAEREREAADEIGRGNEAAQRVRASADRTVIEVTSEARKQAEIIRGEADAKRNTIYAEAYGKDPEFFAFTRSLRAYENALREGNSSIVMQPDSVFFEYLKGPDSSKSGPIQ